SIFPHVWKFFWSPIGDKTLSRTIWYLISCTICALGLFATAVLPLRADTMTLMTAMVLLTNLATTFVGFAVEGMIAHLTPGPERGGGRGWFQAGNLGGTGVGGGLGLLLLQRLPAPWMTGAILGVATLACAIALRFVPKVPASKSEGSLGRAMIDLVRDVWK